MFYEYYRDAVAKCPLEESDPDDQLLAEQLQRNLEAKHAYIRELIGKCLFRLSSIHLIVNSNEFIICNYSKSHNIYNTLCNMYKCSPAKPNAIDKFFHLHINTPNS